MKLHVDGKSSAGLDGKATDQRLRALFVAPEDSIQRTLSVIDAGAKEIALVVDAEGKLAGTVTDGDIRRGMLRGLDLSAPVAEVMCKSPTCLPVGSSPLSILRLMIRRSFHQMPLVDDSGRPVALKTLSELVKFEVGEPRRAVIMAGGRGRRLMPLTSETPKPLLSVGDRPICETIVRELAAAGITHITLCVNYKADAIRAHFGDGSSFGASIDYVQETEPLGTAGALSLLTDRPTAPFVVTNADLLTKIPFGRLLQFHEQEGFDATLCVRRYGFDVPFGVVRLSGSQVEGIDEKPREELFVNAGIYVLDPCVLDHVQPGEALDMPALLDRTREAGRRIGAFPIREYWLDIGNPDDFARAEAEYRRHFGDDPT